MPGYRDLSERWTGPAADAVREAQRLQHDGDADGAVRIYTAAIQDALSESGHMPPFATGRLAMLYGKLGQLDEEVALLERYKHTETSDDTRFRYDARLAKARALAERIPVRDSGALASVRAIPPSETSDPRVSDGLFGNSADTREKRYLEKRRLEILAKTGDVRASYRANLTKPDAVPDTADDT